MVKNIIIIALTVILTYAILCRFHNINVVSDNNAQAYLIDKISALENKIDTLGSVHNKLVEVMQQRKLID